LRRRRLERRRVDVVKSPWPIAFPLPSYRLFVLVDRAREVADNFEVSIASDGIISRRELPIY